MGWFLIRKSFIVMIEIVNGYFIFRQNWREPELNAVGTGLFF